MSGSATPSSFLPASCDSYSRCLRPSAEPWPHYLSALSLSKGAVVHTKSAVAIAAIPSPRPVSPRPSVVVAERLTGAPTASLITSSASARRDPSLGRSPISWTAMLAMSKPAARTRAAVSVRKAAPGALDHSGSARSVVATKVTEPRRAQQRITGCVGDDVTIGVTVGTYLVIKEQTSNIHRPTWCQPMNVDADSGARRGLRSQEARTSSSRTSALSSSTRSARASSETRICRALASMRFSPADRPRSRSRRQRSRTTSATFSTLPE